MRASKGGIFYKFTTKEIVLEGTVEEKQLLERVNIQHLKRYN